MTYKLNILNAVYVFGLLISNLSHAASSHAKPTVGDVPKFRYDRPLTCSTSDGLRGFTLHERVLEEQSAPGNPPVFTQTGEGFLVLFDHVNPNTAAGKASDVHSVLIRRDAAHPDLFRLLPRQTLPWSEKEILLYWGTKNSKAFGLEVLCQRYNCGPCDE